MNPSELQPDDCISIDCEAVRGVTFDVLDVTVEDIGLTEIVAVALVSGSERYAIEWATHSDTANLVQLNGDDEFEIEVADIVQ